MAESGFVPFLAHLCTGKLHSGLHRPGLGKICLGPGKNPCANLAPSPSGVSKGPSIWHAVCFKITAIVFKE